MNGARFRLSVLLSAFFGCWALQMTFGITVRNPLTVVLFVVFYILGLNIPRLGDFGGAFKEAVSLVVGVAAAFLLRGPVTSRLVFQSGIFSKLTIAILFAGFWLLARLIVLAVTAGDFDLTRIKSGRLSAREDTFIDLVKASAPYDKAFGRKAFIITTLVCLICYLPYFLYEFPGIMTADSLDQFDQITYVTPLSNHHPVFHTMLIKFFYNIGLHLTRFHDKTVAISVYTVFQMIFMSLCCGAVVSETLKLLDKKSIRLAALLTAFYALIPYNAVFAVTIWKDVPFAGIAMLFGITILEIIRKKEEVRVFDFVIFTVLGILFCMMRSNAWYAFLGFSLFYLLYMLRSKFFTHAVVTVITCVFVVLIIKGPVFHAMHINGPDFTESLSVPLQQVARVLANDRQIDKTDLELIDEVIDRTYIHELYAPDFADNIKELVRAGHPRYLERHKWEFFSLWLRLGVKYPGDYIAAWFDLVGGYIYTDVPYKVGEVDGIMPNIHYLTWNPIIGGKFIKVKEILLKLSDFMPIYGMLFTVAIYTWALVVSFVRAIRNKKPATLQILMLFLVFTLLIASPVVDFRYAYGLVMTWPLWLLGADKI